MLRVNSMEGNHNIRRDLDGTMQSELDLFDDFYAQSGDDDSFFSRRGEKVSLLAETSSSSDINRKDSSSTTSTFINEAEATKKKKKKSKKSARKKSKRKKNRAAIVEQDNETPLTERDEILVEQLCNFLSDAMSTSQRRSSFLGILEEEGQEKKADVPQSDFDDYDALASLASTAVDKPDRSFFGSLQAFGGIQSVSTPPPASLLGNNVSDHTPLTANYNNSLRSKLAADTAQMMTPSEGNKEGWNQVYSVSAGDASTIPSLRAPSKRTIMSAGDASTIPSLRAPSKRTIMSKDSDALSSLKAPSAQMSQHASTLSSLTPSEHVSRQINQQSDFEEVSPEELLGTLPPELRAYLRDIHHEEEEAGEQSDGFYVVQDNTDMQTVASELTGLTGWASSLSPRPVSGMVVKRLDAQTIASEITGLTGFVTTKLEDDDESDSEDDTEAADSFRDYADEIHTVASKHSKFYKKGEKPKVPTLVNGRARRDKKQLAFSYVYVREYNTIPDDNPACTQGPAVALGGWFPMYEEVFLVETYDKRHRRYNKELILSKHTRESILLRCGYSPEVIQASIRSLKRLRAQRRRTAQSLASYAMERVGRRFKSMLRGGGGGGGNSNRKIVVT